MGKLHGNGYIHGDIKPDNLVYEVMNDKRILSGVIDYDLCIQKPKNRRAKSTWTGTLGYSAPEWVHSDGVQSWITSKVDIFSLGLTMLLLLFGQQPFLCPSAMRQKMQKQNPSIDITRMMYNRLVDDGEHIIAAFMQQ